MDKRRIKTCYFLYFGAFLLIWIALFWKCRFGFPLDESFYILFCYRFINGDIPILHEWNPTQISAVWLHPFVWLFYKINGNNEQVILTFRYFFTAVWGLSSLFLFYRLRKLTLPGACAASLFFLIFVPYEQMALYYNTLGLITFSSSLVIIITAEKYKQLQYTVSGFLFAIAVTCCPFLLLLYLLFFVSAVILLIRKNKRLMQLFCFVTLGTLPAVIIFFCYYVMPSSLPEFLKGLPYLMADREHQFTYAGKCIGFFKSIIGSSPTVIAVILVILISLLFSLSKKTGKIRILSLTAVCISVIALGISYFFTDPSRFTQKGSLVNYLAFPPLFLGLYCGLLTKEKAAKTVFHNLYIPGLIYMFCINISSTVGFEALAIPSVVCSMASFIIVVYFLKENETSEISGMLKKAGLVMVSALAVFYLISVSCIGFSLSYGNGRITDLTARIEQGPFKGLYCSPKIYNAYSDIVRDLEPVKNTGSKKVLLLTNYWFYLDIEKKPSCSSCYNPYIDDVLLDQLEEYYRLYPQFIPDVIYIGNKYTGLLERVRSYGYSGEKTELGGYILYR